MCAKRARDLGRTTMQFGPLYSYKMKYPFATKSRSNNMESVSLDAKEPSFYLFKHKELDGLMLPLRGSQRVFYTSLDVSNNYIALGTNAGGIHIFRRSSLRHYRFLNAKVFPQPESSKIVDIGVSMIQFSSHENFLAAALSSGNVAVWALNFDKREASQLAKKSDEHKGSLVTSLCWNSSSTKLFIGDSKGCVTGLEVSTGKLRTVHTIVKEGPAVIQLDFADEKLLLSNTKRCVFYHPSKDDLIQIGTKGRDGLYGACFVQRQGNDLAIIYCARPGARLWEADNSGHVLSTQQYKKLLAVPRTPLVGHVRDDEKSVSDKLPAYNFPKLLVLRDHFLFTWTRETIIILDPVTGSLVLWNNQFNDIVDICCRRQEIYIFHAGGRVTRYSLIPPKECAAKLFVMGDWLQCSTVLISCKSRMIPLSARDYIPVYVVRRVKEILADDLDHKEIVRELEDLEQGLESAPEDTTTDDDSEFPKSLLVDESETYSVMSDLLSNPDSENFSNIAVDWSGDDVDESNKAEKKEKLSRLKTMFQDHMKDFSLDTVLLAGASAAGHLGWPVTFTPGRNVNTFGSQWSGKSPVHNVSPPPPLDIPGTEKPSSLTGFPGSLSRNESVGSFEEGESDSEGRRDGLLFKEKKKKKHKINTVDLVSPLQPTDLIKMDKARAVSREDLDKILDPSKVADIKITDLAERDDDESSGASETNSGVSNAAHDSGLRSRSVAAKQEVVQKARKLFKRLTPDEKDYGSESTKAHGSKGTGSKGGSTCIHSPLEVKSLIIVSRETRKKIRDSRVLYEPKALRSSLLDWIIYLEKANVAVDRVYPKNKDTREYYVTDLGKVLAPSIKADITGFLDADDTIVVSNLTTMCFKMSIYSSQESLVSQSDPDNPVAEQGGGYLLKCDTCERKPSRSWLDSVWPGTDRDRQDNKGSRRDAEKAQFLAANFPHLDYHSLKASIIANSSDYRNLLKTLLSCLDDFTERDAVDDAIDIGDTKVALQLMRDKAVNYQKRLLRHVFRLYYLVPRDVARLCAQIYPYFHPWEVVLVCLSSSANLLSNCSDFLIYVTHLIQRNAKQSKNSLDILDEIHHDKDFLILVFHSALILDDLGDSDVRCQCGWPRPGSHQTSFQYEELMIEIADRFRACHDKNSLEELLNISWNHGYWQGCIQLLVMLELRTAALELVLKLGDITLVNTKQMWGSLPQTTAEWKYALEFLAAFKSNPGIGGSLASGFLKINDTDQSQLRDSDRKEPEREDNGTGKIFDDISIGKDESEIHKVDRIKHSVLNDSDENEDSLPGLIYQHTCIRNAITGQRSQCIDVKAFLLVLLQKVGPKRTLGIISEAQLKHEYFSHEFYYKCILSSLLESHQSALCHRLLRDVNEHMWSSKCTAMSPQIYQMKEAEILRGSKVKEDVLKGNEKPLHYCRSLEDGACNWGIDLPLPGAVCGLCPLPLCEKLPGHNQGIIIFACGHVFHKECSPENYCLTCFHEKLEIPLTGFAVGSTASLS